MKASRPLMHLAPVARGFGRATLIVVLLAIVTVALGLFSRQRAEARLEAGAEQQIARPVSTVQPKSTSSVMDLALPGNVVARVESPIYARTDGYLGRWFVDIGASVRAGQLLAEIEAPELDRALQKGKADLAAVEAEDTIAQATAERWKSLRESKAVSQQQADEKISAAHASAAQLRAARASLQRLEELSRFKRIVAPFDGIVTVRNTDVGQLIAGGGSGVELFRVADTRRLRVFVHVPQSYAAQMKAGLHASLRFPDRPGLAYEAQLVRTSNALDAGSRTLLAELEVDNSDGELLPGSYAEVHFSLPAATAWRLPTNTLLFRAEGPRIAVVDDASRVVLRPVTLGRDFGTEIEILSGVEASDRVILSPSDSLAEHAEVRIVNPAASGAPS